MSRIREKATESEAVVRNITKEIQVLDLAKKNLILSMTTLKRLQMLGMCAPICGTEERLMNACSKCAGPTRRSNPRAQVSRHCAVPCSMFQFCGTPRGAYIDCHYQAVKQISASFKPYTSVQRIAQLWRRIQEIQSELRTMIDTDWDKLSVHCFFR